MKANQSRRDFIRKGTTLGLACGAIVACPALRASGRLWDDKEEIPDPKKREYCGYKCPDDCEMYQATLQNDPEAKKKAFEKWDLKNLHGVEFDPDEEYCYRCKPGDKPEGFIVKQCEVRKCAIGKKYDCCIECNELKSCSKGVFTRFPTFHQQVIELQEKYRKAQA